MNKFCAKCNKYKDKKEFYRDKKFKDKLSFYCTKCTNSYIQGWNKRNPEKRIKTSVEHSWKRQGITLKIEEYNKLFKKQKGLCAICTKPEIKKQKRLSVDHDHVTGKVRGLLCLRCNSRILSIVENFPDLVEKAKIYLCENVFIGQRVRF